MSCLHGTKDRSPRNAAAFATASNFSFFLFLCLVPWSASADSPDPPAVPNYNPSQDAQPVPHWRAETVRGKEAAGLVFEEETHDRKATVEKRQRSRLTGEKPSSRRGRSTGSVWLSRQSSRLLGAAALALVAFILWRRGGLFHECLPRVRPRRQPDDAGATPRSLSQSTTDVLGRVCTFLLQRVPKTGRKDLKPTEEGSEDESNFTLLTVDGMLNPESGNTGKNGHPRVPLDRRGRRLRLAWIILGVALVLAAVIGGSTYALVGKDVQEDAQESDAQDLTETLTGVLDVYCDLDEKKNKLSCDGKVDSAEDTDSLQDITEERAEALYTLRIPRREYQILVERNSLEQAKELFLEAMRPIATAFDRTYGGSSSKPRFDLDAYNKLLAVAAPAGLDDLPAVSRRR